MSGEEILGIEQVTVPDGYATIRQVMEYLGISRPTVYRLIHDKELPSIRFRKSRRIPWEGVRRFAIRHSNCCERTSKHGKR